VVNRVICFDVFWVMTHIANVKDSKLAGVLLLLQDSRKRPRNFQPPHKFRTWEGATGLPVVLIYLRAGKWCSFLNISARANLEHLTQLALQQSRGPLAIVLVQYNYRLDY